MNGTQQMQRLHHISTTPLGVHVDERVEVGVFKLGTSVRQIEAFILCLFVPHLTDHISYTICR